MLTTGISYIKAQCIQSGIDIYHNALSNLNNAPHMASKIFNKHRNVILPISLGIILGVMAYQVGKIDFIPNVSAESIKQICDGTIKNGVCVTGISDQLEKAYEMCLHMHYQANKLVFKCAPQISLKSVDFIDILGYIPSLDETDKWIQSCSLIHTQAKNLLSMCAPHVSLQLEDFNYILGN